MVEYSREFRTVHKSIWVALALLLVFSFLLQNVAGSVYYSLLIEPNTTVTAPPVILQGGINGTSTIYTNSTSAKVSVSGYGYDFVDNNETDVDLSADIGAHSNFTAQKYGPDLINDTLTEENTGGNGGGTDFPIQNMNFTSDTSSWNFVIVSGTDFAGGWNNTGQTGGSAYIDVTTRNEAGEAYWNQSSVATVNSTLQSVCLNHRWKVEVWNTVDSGTLKVILVHPNGTNWEVWTQTLSGATSWSSLVYTNLTDYFTANGTYSLRLDLVADLGNADLAQLKIYYDDSGIGLVYNGEAANYELDLEVQWTSVDYDETYEELCIKTGTFSGSEDIMVFAWNVSISDWHFLYNLTASSWNNVSVTDWLNNENFTARFLCGTESSDTNQDSWNIDATLLHVWTENDYVYDYVLRVNNTVTDSWQIRLKKYTESTISRLENCTIYFHNSTDGTSGQISIENGVSTQDIGPWYDLSSSEIIYIAMRAEANSTATSYIRTYLEIRIPSTTIYAQYIITFKIT